MNQTVCIGLAGAHDLIGFGINGYQSIADRSGRMDGIGPDKQVIGGLAN